MRLRNIPGAKEAVESSPFCENKPFLNKGRWREVLSGDILNIEIGCGKGAFIIKKALLYKDTAFLGIEQFPTVLFKAIKKYEKEIEKNGEALANLKFVAMDAADITDAFGEGEVDRIYLNFSDPWPKKRHASRRLTSANFLKKYDRILAKGGQIEFKTDNRGLFDFSVEQAPLAGWKIQSLSYDLHADTELSEGNIMTEYEEKFSSMGHPICKFIIER